MFNAPLIEYGATDRSTLGLHATPSTETVNIGATYLISIHFVVPSASVAGVEYIVLNVPTVSSIQTAPVFKKKLKNNTHSTGQKNATKTGLFRPIRVFSGSLYPMQT